MAGAAAPTLVRDGRPRRRPQGRPARAAPRRRTTRAGAPPFGLEWVEAGLPQLRELAAALPDADVWHYVDRGRLETLLAGPPEGRAAVAEGLCRALTVLWWLHGRHELPASPGT